ncbi:FG-GAP repeat protein [Candidatus Peregrinibacteria bacterium]|nr:FG-GAP repeat protein [Candidatus Peregrinibacteria bacterium]
MRFFVRLIPLITAFSIIGATGYAEGLVYELYISLLPEKIAFESDFPGGQFGASLHSGDFDNDGYDDIVIGAPFASIGDKKWAGSATIVFGQPKAADTPHKKLIFRGEASGDQLGTALYSGDFNKDGFDDLAIGAFNAYHMSVRTGRVYVIYGQGNLYNRWGTQDVDFTYYKPDLSLSGREENDGFGLEIHAADVNGDDIEDLLVGSPLASSSDLKNSGLIDVYLGHYDGLSQFSDMAFYGQTEGERFGASIGVGDIGGGNQKDVAIGAYMANNGSLRQAGRVYLFMDITDDMVQIKEPTSYIEGVEEKGWFGFDLEIGNVGKSSVDDLVITSFPYTGNRDNGKVFIFYGNTEFADEGKVFFAKDEGMNSVFAERLYENLLGSNLALMDYNKDGLSEIVAGAPAIGNPKSEYAGNVYIYYGGDFDSPRSYIYGESADDWFGYSFAYGDFDGDDITDLFVGSRYADNEIAVNNGKVNVIFGKGGVFGDKKPFNEGNFVSRGELVKKIIERFDLKNKKAEEIEKCREHKDFCLFNFAAMSDFEGLKFEPQLLLYPDVGAENEYYEDINIATMLNIVNGYLGDEDSPFYPEKEVSRIQALKIVLTAVEAVPMKYKFELINMLGSLEDLYRQISYFDDVNAKIAHMWWYVRYVNFAVENGLIEDSDFFRPDDRITMDELDDLIEKTLKYET